MEQGVEQQVVTDERVVAIKRQFFLVSLAILSNWLSFVVLLTWLYSAFYTDTGSAWLQEEGSRLIAIVFSYDLSMPGDVTRADSYFYASLYTGCLLSSFVFFYVLLRLFRSVEAAVIHDLNVYLLLLLIGKCFFYSILKAHTMLLFFPFIGKYLYFAAPTVIAEGSYPYTGHLLLILLLFSSSLFLINRIKDKAYKAQLSKGLFFVFLLLFLCLAFLTEFHWERKSLSRCI